MPLSTNSIRIEFHKHTTPGIARDISQLLVSTPWKRNWSEELATQFIQWRYCDLKGGEAVVAYNHGRPVGMITSYTRPYLMGGKIVRIREASDWFCLPEYRHLGLGVQLMGKLMDEEEPLVVIGGNENAEAVLPALGWSRLPDVRNYTLPLSAKWLVHKTWSWLHPVKSWAQRARFVDEAWSGPYLRQELALCQPLTLPEAMPRTAPAPGMYDLAPLIREHELQWLYTAPKEMGTFFCLLFPENGGPAGFVIGRFYRYGNSKCMKLIHIQSSTPSVRGYARMLKETISYAFRWKADVAQFRASCRFFRQAIEEFRFIWPASTPSYWWAKSATRPGSNLHLTFLRGDDGIRPYPI